MQETELFERFKNKLIEEYGYDEQDIRLEVKVDGFGRYNTRYIPDIVVYQNNTPYIVIELKSYYSHRIFEQEFENVSQVTRWLNAKYCVIATLDVMEVFELKNNNFYAISNIPNKSTEISNKQSILIDNITIKSLFVEIKDILWSGGKRDSYTIINEFNKILLSKILIEKKENISKNKKFGIYNDGQTLSIVNELFKNANFEFKVFEESEKINLNQKEIEKIVNILKNIELSSIKNIDSLYFDIFVRDLKNGEVFLTDDVIKLLSNIVYKERRILIANSGFGQMSLALSNQIKEFEIIEANSIKYKTNIILQLIKKVDSKHHLGEFLNEGNFDRYTFEQIVSIPPLNLKTKEYNGFYQLTKYSAGTDIATLHIERSLSLLQDNGLLFIALPDSILSNQMFSYVRDFIKDFYQVIAILSFEDGIFVNTSMPSSILILKKHENKGKVTDYNVLVKSIDVVNLENEIKIVQEFITNQHDGENTFHINILNDRWDYHYYKKEFLETEDEIRGVENKPLSDYVDTIRGGGLRSDKQGTINLITVSTIQNGKLDKDKLSFITQEQSAKYIRSLVRENDLVVSAVGKYPRCAKVTAEFEGSNTNSGIIILRIKNGRENEIDKIYNYLNSNLGQVLLHRGVSFTSTVPILTQKELEKIPVIEKEKFDYDKLLTFIDQVQDIPLFKNQQEKNDIYEEQIEPENIVLSLNGIKGRVFGLDVIRCFISLKELVKFEINNQNFQREIDDTHKNELVDFLNNSDYKFFPEIVLAIKDIDKLVEQNIVSFEGSGQCTRLHFHETDDVENSIYKNIEILDGRHRIKSLKEYIEKDSSHENITVSVIFILLSESDSANLVHRAIFYNLNAKAKPLLPKDYLNLLENDDNDTLTELKITNINLFKYLASEKNAIFPHGSNEDILEKCINIVYHLSTHFKSNDLKKLDFLIVLFEKLNRSNLKKYDIHLKTKFYILIIDIISEKRLNRIKIKDYIEKELKGFIEWLEISNLFDSLEKINDFKDFYKTYQKTYVPKSRNIYISMPYHKETEWTYFLIKDVVNEISNNLQIKIVPIRTDEQNHGVHTGISEAVYNQIESCDLMIADLTGGNANVFNEVGFKMGLDKAQGLKETQIIFIVNSKCYYEERLENESFIDNEYKVNGKVLKNNSKAVPFNLRGIKHIEFYNSHYLKAELYKELEKYFSYYKITKVSK